MSTDPYVELETRLKDLRMRVLETKSFIRQTPEIENRTEISHLLTGAAILLNHYLVDVETRIRVSDIEKKQRDEELLI